ncbi:ATP-grasp domain-containing protein [Chitiniphilus eburneus]|uniref:ATP-grasp domain-containing protein n=1 Tax=Chitiniphilus eburneus TaxID=2571148 RepID=A0A4U0PG98_9NEIS|nr:ATP-grasp domain-containing protein [Chitiniphilus eburneus]TJZ66837.1 ATP-grasp domain-containing protein [Chitiniphilus eburneus]
MKQGFLILSHQGLSMVAPLAAELARRGYAACVLSSASARGLHPEWAEQVDHAAFTDDHALSWPQVDTHLDTLAGQYRMVGCISVWDGYRGLMAQANQRLGACDVPATVIDALRDKLAMRDTLARHGLTKKTAQPLTPERFAALEHRAAHFIKPRTGLASFGTFRADRLTHFDELAALWRLACEDAAYSGIFSGEPAFIVEDLIRGPECSFEVSVERGCVCVHAVHEKIDLQSHGRTTLENACTCPPLSLPPQAAASGHDFIARCLAAFGIQSGVYHIEARHHPEDGWEIIEINPRIGGAYIVDSTQLHSGVDLLARWLDLLTGRIAAPAHNERRHTFFRVFFGESGRTVRQLSRRDTGQPALRDKLFVREGERLPQVEREIFIGQALWDITALSTAERARFVIDSQAHFAIEYHA